MELPWVCSGHLVKSFINDLSNDDGTDDDGTDDDGTDTEANYTEKLLAQINSFVKPYPLPPTISPFTLCSHSSLNEFSRILDSLTELNHWNAEQFIQSANYWLVDDTDLPGVVLVPLIRAVYTNPQFINRLTKYYNRPKLASFLTRSKNVLCRNQLSNYWLLVSAQHGFIQFVQYLCELHSATSSEPISWTVWAHAAKHGQLACLQYAHKNNHAWNEHVFTLAASHGHLECLQFLCKCSPNGSTCPLDIGTYAIGHLPCLRYVRELNKYDIELEYIIDVMIDGSFYVTSDWFERKTYGDRVEILKYLFAELAPGLPRNPLVDGAFQYDAVVTAVCYDRLDCLIYLHETMGFPLAHNLSDVAARKNSLDCLKYLHKKGHRLPSVLYLYDYDNRIQRYILRSNASVS